MSTSGALASRTNPKLSELLARAEALARCSHRTLHLEHARGLARESGQLWLKLRQTRRRSMTTEAEREQLTAALATVEAWRSQPVRFVSPPHVGRRQELPRAAIPRSSPRPLPRSRPRDRRVRSTTGSRGPPEPSDDPPLEGVRLAVERFHGEALAWMRVAVELAAENRELRRLLTDLLLYLGSRQELLDLAAGQIARRWPE